jgi:hypothetical protein
MAFVSALLVNGAFQSKLVEVQDEDGSQIDAYFRPLIESLLNLVNVASKHSPSDKTQFANCMEATFVALDNVNRLLPVTSFTAIVAQLVKHSERSVCVLDVFDHFRFAKKPLSFSIIACKQCRRKSSPRMPRPCAA